jgi:hypothetical protein
MEFGQRQNPWGAGPGHGGGSARAVHLRLVNGSARKGAASPSSQHHEGTLVEQIDLSNWETMSINRAVEEIQSRLQGGLTVLATVGSPFVGLFGTVWGIYYALTAIGISGQASIGKMARRPGSTLPVHRHSDRHLPVGGHRQDRLRHRITAARMTSREGVRHWLVGNEQFMYRWSGSAARPTWPGGSGSSSRSRSAPF